MLREGGAGRATQRTEDLLPLHRLAPNERATLRAPSDIAAWDENVHRAVAGDPGPRGGLPLPLLLQPLAGAPAPQPVGGRHEAPGRGHGAAAPGAPPRPGPEAEAAGAGPLLLPQERDGRGVGGRAPQLGPGGLHLQLRRGGGQAAAGAAEPTGPARGGGGGGAGARQPQAGAGHRRLPGGREEGLAAGAQWMGRLLRVLPTLGRCRPQPVGEDGAVRRRRRGPRRPHLPGRPQDVHLRPPRALPRRAVLGKPVRTALQRPDHVLSFECLHKWKPPQPRQTHTHTHTRSLVTDILSATP